MGKICKQISICLLFIATIIPAFILVRKTVQPKGPSLLEQKTMLMKQMNARLQPLSENESDEEMLSKRSKESKIKKKSKNIRQRKESSSEEDDVSNTLC